MDGLQCEICGKSFNTNAGLYTHKQRIHNNTASVVLVNHNRHQGRHWKPSKRRWESEPESEIKDKYIYPPKKHRNDEGDDGLKIIDEYNDGDDAELNDDMEVIDEYDPPQDVSTDEDDVDLPSPSSPVQPIIPSSQLNYKALYEKCRQKYNKVKLQCKKKLNMLNKKHKEALKRDLNELNDKRDADIADMRDRFRKQMNDLEQTKNLEIDDRIRGIQNEQQDTLKKISVEHQRRIVKLEAECEDKIKVLNTHIKDLQDEGDEFTSLSNAIFNCTTIEEIFEIERLIKNHQLDVVAQNHLKTLQNLFLSLSYGILPICDVQRKMITPKQRTLIEKIQSSSSTAAKRHLKEGRSEIINLFTVINDSLKLIRNTFNRYGTLPDA